MTTGQQPPPPIGLVHPAYGQQQRRPADFQPETGKLPDLAPDLPAKPGVLDRDPGGLVAAIQGVVLATLAVLNGFEIVHWTEQQQGLVWALVLAVLTAVQLIIGRGRAYAPTTVVRLLNGRR
jgi:hypothetical protein